MRFLFQMKSRSMTFSDIKSSIYRWLVKENIYIQETSLRTGNMRVIGWLIYANHRMSHRPSLFYELCNRVPTDITFQLSSRTIVVNNKKTSVLAIECAREHAAELNDLMMSEFAIVPTNPSLFPTARLRYAPIRPTQIVTQEAFRRCVDQHNAHIKTLRRIVVDNVDSLNAIYNHPDFEDKLVLIDLMEHDFHHVLSVEDGPQEKIYIYTHAQHYDDVIANIKELNKKMLQSNRYFETMTLHAASPYAMHESVSQVQTIHTTYLQALLNDDSKQKSSPPSVIRVSESSKDNSTATKMSWTNTTVSQKQATNKRARTPTSRE